MISAVRSLAAYCFLLVFLPLAAVITIPWTLLTGNADFLYSFAMRGVRAALWLAGIKVETAGMEALAACRTYIFMSNHVSNLDAPALIPILPGRTSILVKKELFRVPILGPAMRLASLVPVDRSKRESAIASVGRAAEVIGTGLHMTIFPEGTRSRDGCLLPFKKGPFYLAMESGAPVVPVTILNTLALMPKGRLRIRGGVVKIVFHPPLAPADFSDRDALMAAVVDAIAASQ